MKTNLDKEMIRTCGFVLKQIMPYYDRYCDPYFKGVDYDVVEHGMPGGATSSSQEGAMKQGYIHLLPYMLKFLAGTRKVTRYHDVTPGSQITWNTAFLGVTGAYKRGGEEQVRRLLKILETVTTVPESDLSSEIKKDRLKLYRDCNDAFRDLLLGKFGKLPLGFPEDWVYQSAFGSDYKSALVNRTEESPLIYLEDVDMDAEYKALMDQIKRQPTEEELVMYLNHPGDALKTIEFKAKYGDPNHLSLDIWFEGLEKGEEATFVDSKGKPHAMMILDISEPDEAGMSVVRYLLDSGIYTHQVKVEEPSSQAAALVEMVDPNNPYHAGSPSNGDLWVMYVSPGDYVKKGDELFNISIMKQEKAVLAKTDGMVSRVLKSANYQQDKRMVPVKESELLVELSSAPASCPSCNTPVPGEDFVFCPFCGHAMKEE